MPPSTPSPQVAAFRRLHEAGCFVLPNPWDRGSARLLHSLGFAALATTSAGLAFALGRPDSPRALDRDLTLANVRDIVAATPLPVTADFQDGYGRTPDEVHDSVARCAAVGAAGLSIEDATGDADAPLYPLPMALDRLRAARAAIDASGTGALLTARAECFLTGHPDPLAESLRRLVAYAEHGADCVYAPGVRAPADIARIVAAAAPLPVNVLAADPATMTLPLLRDLGVRRVSIGSALARVGWQAVTAAATALRRGDLAPLAAAAPFAELNGRFGLPSGNG
ncbi:MAG: isocitrate lyase/phosphoenolpyruvate mutase family protein [Planctomycetota bacterium]